MSSGPFAKVTKNLKIRGTGIRNTPFATADVWAYNRYAYTGTFDRSCGTDESGVWIWDVRNKKKVKFVGIITSPIGSRASDVKVAAMNSGDILVHSNQDCDGGNVPPYVPGRGGFEIYNANDPTNPVHLASVQTDDVNAFLRDNFTLTDLGVNNVFLFTKGIKDYVAAVVNSDFGNFQIFDITNPRNPSLVGYWGAEQLNQTEVTDWASLDDEAIINEARAYLNDGYGDDGDRFLRDITITADGKHAYVSSDLVIIIILYYSFCSYVLCIVSMPRWVLSYP